MVTTYAIRNVVVESVTNTPIIPTKPTRNRPQTEKNDQIEGEIVLQSALIRFCRFGVGLCSGRQTFWKISPDKLSVVCRLYVGVASVLLGSVRGRVGINSATDARWLVGIIRLVMYRAYVPDTDSRRIKSDMTPNWVESADNIPESKPTSARHISNPNRIKTDNYLWLHTYTYIPKHTKISENITSPK